LPIPENTRYRIIQNVPQSASVDWGTFIQLDVEFSDGQVETFRVPSERAPRLIHAIHQAAEIAEKQRKLQPGEMLEIVSAYIVQDCQAHTSNDNQTIGVVFLTGSGFPVQIAMSKEIALKAVERISQQLDQLDTRPPRKPS
jgi:hypothetical protein